MAEKNDLPGFIGSTTTGPTDHQQFFSSFISEIIKSPINLALVGIISFLIYKIFKRQTKSEQHVATIKQLPKLRRDFAIEELRKYDGTGPDGRILVAVNGSVYDMTKGAQFYGPGGPYAAFAGHDASRNLATFTATDAKDVYDDLSDLNTAEMDSLKEWEEQFKEKYDYVGKLLKPGEQPTNYSDEEDEGSQQEIEGSGKTKSKDD